MCKTLFKYYPLKTINLCVTKDKENFKEKKRFIHIFSNYLIKKIFLKYLISTYFAFYLEYCAFWRIKDSLSLKNIFLFVLVVTFAALCISPLSRTLMKMQF